MQDLQQNLKNKHNTQDRQNRRAFLRTSTKIAGALTLASMGMTLFANTQTTSIKEQGMNSLTPTAKDNLQRLFGTSELPKEDLEFFTNYANFAFDEVFMHSQLEEKERLLIILASLSAIPAPTTPHSFPCI